jgi:hypothetical protein
MRLGQLARKLDIKTNDIISFLQKEHSITIDDSLNTKIEKDVLDLVNDKFEKPAEIEEVLDIPEIEPEIREEIVESKITLEETHEPNIEVVQEIVEKTEPESEIIKEVETPEEVTELPTDVDPNETEEELYAIDEDGEKVVINMVDGVIKAPKKELEGFKVIGKIQLPGTKHKIEFISTSGNVTTNVTEEIVEKKQSILEKRKSEKQESRKRKVNSKVNNKTNPRKKTTELDRKLKEQELAVKKQVESRKLEKIKKAEFYKKNVLPKAKEKNIKTKVKKVKKDELKSVKTYDKEPTTKLGKIWKWFNT